MVWKNKSNKSKVKSLDKISLQWKNKEMVAGNSKKIVFSFETTIIGFDTLIIQQCKKDINRNLSKCYAEQKFPIEIIANEPFSKEIPPNGTFIFTVKDFEASKNGKWKVVIKGNRASIYCLGQEIWDTASKKGDLLNITNIIKYKGKWISVANNELDKNFETLNGGQFEIWDFKNKVIGSF